MMHAIYSGSTDDETYSSISTFTSGSYYDDINDTVLNCVVDVVERRKKEKCSVFTVADFGTADGVNFTTILKEILETIDAHTGDSNQTMVYLEDNFRNDFNLLISKLERSENKLSWKQNAFFAAIGKSMYSQCLPAASLDIGISSIAVHWMSKIPVLKDGLTHLHADAYEMRLYSEQATEDWKTFLMSRGQELKEGGFLVVLLPVIGEGNCAPVFLLCASEAWRRMMAKGRITHEEFQRANTGHYPCRTEEDLKLPFGDPEVLSLGLHLVSMKPRSHLLKPLIQLRQYNDKQTYMKAAVKFVQPFIRNAVFIGLSDDRSSSEKDELIAEYFTVLFNVFFEADVKLDKMTNEEVIVQKKSKVDYVD